MRSQIIHPKDVIGLRYELPKCYPFVKWAGEMAQLLSKLDKYFPPKISSSLGNPFASSIIEFVINIIEEIIRKHNIIILLLETAV